MPDYEDQFMDPNIDELQVGDPKNILTRGNYSIFDTKKLKPAKQASHAVRRSVGRGLTQSIPQTLPATGESVLPA